MFVWNCFDAFETIGDCKDCISDQYNVVLKKRICSRGLDPKVAWSWKSLGFGCSKFHTNVTKERERNVESENKK